MVEQLPLKSVEPLIFRHPIVLIVWQTKGHKFDSGDLDDVYTQASQGMMYIWL